MTLRYPTSGRPYSFGVERSKVNVSVILGLGLTAIRHGFKLYECLLVLAMINFVCVTTLYGPSATVNTHRPNCRNDHEIIQLFLSRGHVVDHPHLIYCKCPDCEHRQSTDSLKRSLSRLNAYKALSSPAFMALSSVDPITVTFELRQEMMKVVEVEKEFKVSQGQDVLSVLVVSGCEPQFTI